MYDFSHKPVQQREGTLEEVITSLREAISFAKYHYSYVEATQWEDILNKFLTGAAEPLGGFDLKW